MVPCSVYVAQLFLCMQIKLLTEFGNILQRPPKLLLKVQLFALQKSFTHTYSCDKTTAGWLSNS